MSITDADLQFVADAMWQDALLPDLDDVDGLVSSLMAAEAISQPNDNVGSVGSEASQPEAPSKTAKRPAKSKTPTAGPATVPAKKAAEKKVARTRASPLTDLYLSSPVASLARSKNDRKLSKSMKGASQNESQQARSDKQQARGEENAERLVSSEADPYGLPVSPLPGQAKNGSFSETPKPAPPVASAEKSVSPLRLIPASEKRRPKNQKRVAKQSFLDAAEAQETEPAKPELSGLPDLSELPDLSGLLELPEVPETLPQAPSPPVAKKSNAKAKPKPKPKSQPKNKKKPLKKTIEEPLGQQQKLPKAAGKDEPMVRRPLLTAKAVVTPVEGLNKKLRPRGGRVPIIISSDSDSSYGEDEGLSDAGFVPDTGDTSLGEALTAPELQTAVKQQFQPVQPRQPVQKASAMPTETAARQARALKTPVVSPLDSRPTAPKSGTIKEELASTAEIQGELDIRVREASAVTKGHKHGAPLDESQRLDGHHEKKQRRSSKRDTSVAHHPRSLPHSVRTTRARDPFVESHDDERLQQTQFTAKLLQSAVPSAGPQMDDLAVPEGEMHVQRANADRAQSRLGPQPRVLTHDRVQAQTAESEGVARDMMQRLVTGSASGQAEAGRDGRPASAKAIWLSETDPYKDTSQIMGYVCKSILRFLKSKEAAIEDVADEYQQRGSTVLARVRDLHQKESSSFAHSYEDKRLQSLAVFEAASRDVHRLATQLEHVSLAAAVNDVLSDSAVTRLRALQAEIV